MALLQRTLTTGSIWIGTGSAPAIWNNYNTLHNQPLAIYKNQNPVFSYNIQDSDINMFYLNTTSIRSANYKSGFDPTSPFDRGFAIDLIDRRYVAQFDDLWIRGTMNVHEFVINQIRATNGSLWVSDAAKAIKAESKSNELILTFPTESALPFAENDIIRSKRWIVTDNQLNNWDIITVITDIDYGNYIVTGSLTGNNYWTASPQCLDNLINSAGSDWVRVGNTNNLSRQGGIYLTSGDKDSPYIDIYDSVSTVVNGHYNNSASINHKPTDDVDTLKVRLGKLIGINDTEFGGQLRGYGLYSDNAYLKGKIIANTGGNIAGWTISPGTLSNKDMRLVASNNESYLGISASTYNSKGIWFGTSSNGIQAFIGDPASSYLKWTNTQLQISSSNFSMASGNVTMSGKIQAGSGNIAGWNISSQDLYNTNVRLHAGSTSQSINIGSTGYSTSGIYLGSSSVGGNRLSITNLTNGLFWDGNNLGVSTSNFTLSQGKITAKGGSIAGWNINQKQISKSVNSSTLTMRCQPSSNWDYVDNTGYVFNPLDPHFAVILNSYYKSSYETSEPWEGLLNTSSVTTDLSKKAIIKYTSSFNMNNSPKNIVTWKPDYKYQIIVEGGQTIYIGIDQLQFDQAMMNTWCSSNYHDTLILYAYTGSAWNNVLAEILIMKAGILSGTRTSLIQKNLFASYTNTGSQGQTLSLGLLAKTSGRPDNWNLGQGYDLLGFTLSGITVFGSEGYTQLNPEGLLIYAGPTNYIKLTTHPLQTGSHNYGVIAVDQLYVAGESIKGGTIVEGGGSGGIDGGGTSGYFSMWLDQDTIGNSHLYYDGNNINSDKPIIVPSISSSGLGSFGNITTSGYIKAQGAISSSVGFSASGTSSLQSLTLGTALTVGNGGTGRTNFSTNHVLLGNGSNGLTTSNTPTNGTVFTVNSGVPSFESSLTLGNNLNVQGHTILGNSESDHTEIFGILQLKYNNEKFGNIQCDSDKNLIIYGNNSGSGVCIEDGVLVLNDITIQRGTYNGTSPTIATGQKIIAINGFANDISDEAATFQVDQFGNLECTSLKETSLRKYKHDIYYITESQLENISKLKPITFLYNTDVPQNINDPQIRQAGFLAEQVQKIYPEVAWYKNGELAGLQYQRLTAYLTKAIQELIKQNKELKNRITKLENINKKDNKS